MYLDIIMPYQKNEEIDESMLKDLIKTERIKKLSKLLGDPTGIEEELNKESTEAEILQIFRNTAVESLIKEKYSSNKSKKMEINPEYTESCKFEMSNKDEWNASFKDKINQLQDTEDPEPYSF